MATTWGWHAPPTSCIQASQLGYVAGGSGKRWPTTWRPLHPSFTAWLRCRRLALGAELAQVSRLHPSFTAWLRCRLRTARGRSRSRGVASKLHSLATLQAATAAGRSGPAQLHPSFTAWLRCRSPKPGVDDRGLYRCIQASQLGYVAGFAGGYGVWGVSPGCIQASQLGYVAGPRRPCTTSWSGPLHPSFTAWLRCRCPSMAMVMARSAQLHPSFTAWLRCRYVVAAIDERGVECCIQASQLGYVAG